MSFLVLTLSLTHLGMARARPAEPIALLLFSLSGFLAALASESLLVLMLCLELAWLPPLALVAIDSRRLSSSESSLKLFFAHAFASLVFAHGIALALPRDGPPRHRSAVGAGGRPALPLRGRHGAAARRPDRALCDRALPSLGPRPARGRARLRDGPHGDRRPDGLLPRPAAAAPRDPARGPGARVGARAARPRLARLPRVPDPRLGPRDGARPGRPPPSRRLARGRARSDSWRWRWSTRGGRAARPSSWRWSRRGSRSSVC